jgi:DNA-binding CsgD family transcriptional regulator
LEPFVYSEGDHPHLVDGHTQLPVSKSEVEKAEFKARQEEESRQEQLDRLRPEDAEEARKLVPQLLAILTPKQAWVLRQLIDGYSVRELAEIMNVEPSSIIKLKDRALATLRREVDSGSRLSEEVVRAVERIGKAGEEKRSEREGRVAKGRSRLSASLWRRGRGPSRKEMTSYEERRGNPYSLAKKCPGHGLPPAGPCILCARLTGNFFDGRWMCCHCEYR